MTTSPFIHPDRSAPKIRPFKALSHFNKLIANKEDTEQVFHIIEALNGTSLVRSLKRFAATEKGAARLAEKRFLPPQLDDHGPLHALPEGSVGRTYAEFMEREGLTAQGLVDESEKFYGDRPRFDDDLEWFGNRLRDTHDLFHILTGYGRDPLGEDALLAFSYSQNKGRGVIFIAWMGARHISKLLPKDVRVMDILKEGKRNGAIAEKLAAEDITSLLKEPLEDARARLGIQKPELYERAWKAFGPSLDTAIESYETVAEAA